MTEVYLFDWGDTLMVDFPGATGKMCDWETVEVVQGAADALRFISQKSKVFVATGAAHSTKEDIKLAFKRVDLDRYITDYFCKANLGVDKSHAQFLPLILEKLGKEAKQVTMIGDSLEKDIMPALKLGINAILLSKDRTAYVQDSFKTITSLTELCS